MVTSDIAHTHYVMRIPEAEWGDILTNSELPQELRFHDESPLQLRVVNTALAVFRDLAAVFQSIPSRIFTAFRHMPFSEYCSMEDPESWRTWNPESSGLHVCIHGFHGHPAIWDPYISSIRQREAEADIRVPFVPKAGNCSLEEATAPIREMVRSYIENQIDKKENSVIPISIYGVSNGSRIALNALNGLIDDGLKRRLEEKRIHIAIKVDAIAGVLRGTQALRLRMANGSDVMRWIARNVLNISEEILTDFQYEGESSRRLIENIRKINNTANLSFKYNFYSSTEDGLVIPQSSLPVLGKGETHHVVHCEGHTSIVRRVLPQVMASYEEWKTPL